MMYVICGFIVDVGNEVIFKFIYFLNLFSFFCGYIYFFGFYVVEIEFGGNDFIISYQYKIEVKDLEGLVNVEIQFLFV